MDAKEGNKDRTSLVLLLEIMAGAIIVLTYTEAKFASKDAMATEAEQRKTDVQRIESAIGDQGKKIDAMYQLMLSSGQRRTINSD